MRLLFVVILLAALPGFASAQGSRAGAWEWSFAAIYQDSASSGADGGSNLRLDNELGLGFGFGYNFTDKLYLGGDFEWLRPDFTATLINENDPNDRRQINHTMSQFNGRIKGTLTFLSGPLSPYVEAGLGWSYFDSNVADGPPITGCWWHPWWGYICNSWIPTYDRTSFSFGGGIGIRADVSRSFFLELSYNGLWVDFSESTPGFDGIRLNIGWLF